MSSLADGRSFHLRIFDKNYNYEKIDNLLANFNAQTAEQLEKPILKGTLCAAKYAADGKWYRARVVQSLPKGQLELSFIDYGISSIVNSSDSGSLRKLPAHLL